MHYPDRTTVCVSSQAGCAMGCGFCATGQAGFQRQLTTGEIVEQVVRAARRARDAGRRLGNVVFMGMGEPLANFDRVWTAVERLHGDIGLSARHITVSTVGMVPGIRRLAGEDLPVNLAVSLHAANDDLRNELVPINRRYPLSVLMGACADYLRAKGRRLSFEWALIDGTNDRRSDARELAELARAPAAARPREPHPPQPDARLPDPGHAPRRRPTVPRAARRPGGQRHHPPQPRHRHRRRLRPARGPGRAAVAPRRGQRTSTVIPAPARTASTSASPRRTTVPGHSTDRSTEPSTVHPSPTTGAPALLARLAAR